MNRSEVPSGRQECPYCGHRMELEEKSEESPPTGTSWPAPSTGGTAVVPAGEGFSFQRWYVYRCTVCGRKTKSPFLLEDSQLGKSE
jgi:DNA-directed RNA polymerase subunit RPC12/RpoP